MRRRRLLLLILLVLFVGWAAGAGLVMFWDPKAPVEMPVLDGPHNPFIPRGYTAIGASASWEGDSENPPEDAYRDAYVLQRGPLDRDAAEFPLSLQYRTSLVGQIQVVSLSVTSDSDWADRGDDADWQTIARASLQEQGDWCVAMVKEAPAPASACAVRVEVVSLDGSPAGGFSRAMPEAPTFLGRLHDRIAWRPIYRWLPDIR